MTEWDYIIVGAGSAGALLASRLSADPTTRVLVLEAGGSDARLWIRTPIGYGQTFTDPRVNWCLSTEADAGLDGRVGYWPRGKVLGGSGSINAMVWCRGQAADYDAWAAAGNPGWGWQDVAAAFARIEGDAGRADAITLTRPDAALHPVRAQFDTAAQALGWATGRDLAGADGEGVGPYAITTRGGRRCTSATAFLRPALRRANLSLQMDCEVTGITLEGRRATGVSYRRDGREMVARARAEVILCAGAIHSPKLLQVSGIGPADLLRRHGIAVRHANRAVGAHLQDHVGISYHYTARVPTLNGVLGTRAGRGLSALQYLLWRSGPLSLSINQMGGFVRGRPDCDRPNIQLYFNPISIVADSDRRRDMLRPGDRPGFIIGFNACRPTSRGHVEIASADPSAAMRIWPNALSTAHDVDEALQGARLVGRLQETAPLRRIIAERPPVDPAAAGDEAVLADFRARASTVFHPCGTCRMAPEAEGGVVDADLRVHGVAGLRVVDASVFPSIPSANTNAPSVMVAEMAATRILAHHTRKAAPCPA